MINYKELIKKELQRLVNYGLVGVAALFVCIAIAFSLRYLFNAPLLISNACGLLSGAVISYFGSQALVFKAESTVKAKLRFLYLISFNLFLASVVLKTLTDRQLLTEWLSLLISIGIIPISNYWILKLLVFSPLKTNS
ncbi:MAG: putative flippase GtrA [Chitinophagales bacterium]|jgi:putative flippase GtrA